MDEIYRMRPKTVVEALIRHAQEYIELEELQQAVDRERLNLGRRKALEYTPRKGMALHAINCKALDRHLTRFSDDSFTGPEYKPSKTLELRRLLVKAVSHKTRRTRGTLDLVDCLDDDHYINAPMWSNPKEHHNWYVLALSLIYFTLMVFGSLRISTGNMRKLPLDYSNKQPRSMQPNSHDRFDSCALSCNLSRPASPQQIHTSIISRQLHIKVLQINFSNLKPTRWQVLQHK
ncbi:hypothetical protein L484_011705 [Morus notabilis]|uniref:Uncharacterized protein n=1 Tax=Morus notabilis TaxID=981085 RepID=W9S7U0_9ROSA|nr:hypothetical protein L484_011705 [Morus notabilis]